MRPMIVSLSRKRVPLVIWLLLSAVVATASAASLETERKMKEVRTAAARNKSFSIEILPQAQDTLTPPLPLGKVLWAEPHLYRIESEDPVPGIGKVPHITVCDGNTVWSYYPGQNVAYKIDAALLKTKYGEEALLKTGVLLNSDPFQAGDDDKAKFIEENKVDGVSCYLFELPIESKSARILSPHRVLLWVGVKDGILRRQETFSQSGERVDQKQIRVVNLNMELAADTFRLELPQGCKIEDVTSSVEAMLKESK